MNEILTKIKDFYKKYKKVCKKVCILCCIIFFFIAFDTYIRRAFNNSDLFTSYCEMAVEITFLYYLFGELKMTRESFELTKKEFEMTKENFEWIKKDRREEKTRRELCYFAFIVLDNFANYYKNFIDKNDLIVLKSITNNDKKIVNDLCEKIIEKYPLPFSFCEFVITKSIKDLIRQFQKGERIDDIEIYDCLLEKADHVFTMNALTPNFINKSSKYFNSDDEIDEIYEKLTNFKL